MNDAVLLSEAAKVIGKSANYLRTLLNEGRIKGTKDPQGRHRVRVADLIGYFATSESRPPTLDQRSVASGDDALLLSYQGQIRSLEETLRHERNLNQMFVEQISKLQNELLSLTHEMKAVLDGDTAGKLSRFISKFKSM